MDRPALPALRGCTGGRRGVAGHGGVRSSRSRALPPQPSAAMLLSSPCPLKVSLCPVEILTAVEEDQQRRMLSGCMLV